MSDGLETRFVAAAMAEVDGATIVGYPIVFNSDSVDLGGFIERIASSAIDRTLREGIDVRGLWNHNADIPLGRRGNGTLRLQKDSHGLRVEIDPPDTNAGRDAIENVRSGLVVGAYFAFRGMPGGDEWFMGADNIPRRTVHDMRVSEISVGVSFPAYQQTNIGVALESLRKFQQQHRGSSTYSESLEDRARWL